MPPHTLEGTFLFDSKNQDYLDGKRRLQPAPNEMSWFAAFISILLVGGMGIFVLLLNHAEERDRAVEQALETHGVETSAFVVSCTIGRGNVVIAYRYSLDNDTYRGSDTAPGHSCAVYGNGRRIAILYLPNAPGESKLSDGRVPGSASMVYLCVSSAFFVVAALGGTNEVRAGLRRRRLAHQGVLLRGEITGAQHVFVARVGKVVEVSYTFMTPAGESLTGTQHSKQTNIECPLTGTPVYVLYVSDTLYRAL
jgi:hypothetical protein